MLEYEFLKAEKVSDALEYLEKYNKVKLIAGGTDILVEMHKDKIDNEEMDYLLDISNIDELKEINEKDNYIEFGALITHSEIANNTLVEKLYPVLAEAALTIGSTQIRNRATIAGNVVNASPAADLIPPLIALKAEVVLKSESGERVITIPEFVTAPYSNDLKDNEVLTKIRIPKFDKKYYSIFKKIKRRKAVDIARLNIAVVTTFDEKMKFKDTRIVPGSATPSPQSFKEVEKMLEGHHIDEINMEDIAEKAAEEMLSITGERWSTPYKKPAIGTLVKRALSGIIKEVKDNV